MGTNGSNDGGEPSASPQAVRRRPPARWSRRITVAAIVCVTSLTGTAAAAIVAANFAETRIGVVDAAPVYAYESGTKAEWLTHSAFFAGTYSNTQSNRTQGYAIAQITGGVPSVRTGGWAATGRRSGRAPTHFRESPTR